MEVNWGYRWRSNIEMRIEVGVRVMNRHRTVGAGQIGELAVNSFWDPIDIIRISERVQNYDQSLTEYREQKHRVDKTLCQTHRGQKYREGKCKEVTVDLLFLTPHLHILNIYMVKVHIYVLTFTILVSSTFPTQHFGPRYFYFRYSV